MKKEHISDALNMLNDDIIEETDKVRANAKPKRPWITWGAVAACLCLAVMSIVVLKSFYSNVDIHPDEHKTPPTEIYWNKLNIGVYSSDYTPDGANKINVNFESIVNLFGGSFLPESIMNQYTLQEDEFSVLVDGNNELLSGYPVRFSYRDDKDKSVIEVTAEKTDIFDVAELYSGNKAVKSSLVNGHVVFFFESSESDVLWAQMVILSPAFQDNQDSGSRVGIDEDGNPDRILLTIESRSILNNESFLQIITEIIGR